MARHPAVPRDAPQPGPGGPEPPWPGGKPASVTDGQAAPVGPKAPRGARGGVGRACIGLGLTGQGLGILTGIVPHEDAVVGAGLLAFGAVLLATSRLPLFPVGRRLLAWTGAALLAAAVAAWLWTGEPPVGPKAILVVLGAASLAAAALHRHAVQVRGVTLRMGDLVACAFVAVAAPLAVWSAQAAFKHAAGSTPLEVFMMAFLVVPVHWLLGGLGLESQVDGQTLTLAGPAGPMRVEIGVACSGIQAMALFLVILGLFAALERPTGRRLGAWVAVGLVGVYVTNLVRLVAILLAGHWWGPVTLEQFHANLGWAFFVAWTLLFAWWVRRGLDADARLA